MTQPANLAFTDALATWQQGELARVQAQAALETSAAAFSTAQAAAIATIRTLQSGGTVDNAIGLGTALVAAQADLVAKKATLDGAIAARDYALHVFCVLFAAAIGYDPVLTETFIRGAI